MKQCLSFFCMGRRVIKRAAVVITGGLMLITLVACKDKGDSKASEVSETLVVSQNVDDVEAKLEELRSTYMSTETSEVLLPQYGNYVIDGVELCDAAVAEDACDDTWEGYTEAELGFLRPESMPNCILDEEGNHWVMFDGIPYVYVNDFNANYGEYSQFSDLSNVWCTMDPSNRKVLSDLEDYGKQCAGNGGNAE